MATREQLFTEAAEKLKAALRNVCAAALQLDAANASDLTTRARVLESQTYKLLEDVAGAAAAEMAEKRKREMLEDEEEAQQDRKVRPIRRAQ